MEKELYFRLVSNDGHVTFCETLPELAEKISFDVLDIEPSDREKVAYVVQPVYMTEKEFSSRNN